MAHELYSAIVRHARFPLYYQHFGVPDTPEGRFEMVALHAGLVVRRLACEGKEEQDVAQSLFDLMFADIDVNLRELGVGDLSVGKEVKRLARQFYARLDVLDRSFAAEGDHQPLRSMLEANLFQGTVKPSARTLDQFVDVIVAIERCLAKQSGPDLKRGVLSLPEEGVLLSLCCDD
ncbi:MAG: ubiquinol-cytochrome C chaperone family protein [Geminicoccaceae bacterium]